MGRKPLFRRRRMLVNRTPLKSSGQRLRLLIASIRGSVKSSRRFQETDSNAGSFANPIAR